LVLSSRAIGGLVHHGCPHPRHVGASNCRGLFLNQRRHVEPANGLGKVWQRDRGRDKPRVHIEVLHRSPATVTMTTDASSPKNPATSTTTSLEKGIDGIGSSCWIWIVRYGTVTSSKVRWARSARVSCWSGSAGSTRRPLPPWPCPERIHGRRRVQGSLTDFDARLPDRRQSRRHLIGSRGRSARFVRTLSVVPLCLIAIVAE